MPTDRLRRLLWGAISIVVGVSTLLWLLNAPYRQVYQPTHDDVTALADGLLLLPGAHWYDWFARGHSYFFDTYPEWPQHDTAFSRPVFQSVIYLGHFLFGRSWASYLAINYISIAGVGAVAFAIARTAVGLGAGASLLAAALTILSSAVLEFSVGILGAGSECLAALLIGCGFLAVAAQRDALCALLLFLALLTKETAVWAPVAACLTVLLRSGDRSSARPAIAAAMLAPLVAWLGMRLVFYGGVGGTYATADYAPLTTFLKLTLLKIRHLHHLFIAQAVAGSDWQWPLIDRSIRIGAALLVILLLIPWAVGGLRRAWVEIAGARGKRRRPELDASTLVTIWAVTGLAFYFTLALSSPRYAAAAVMFAWPSIIGEVARRRSLALRLALAGCLAISLAQTVQLLAASNPPAADSGQGKFFRAAAAMNAALRQTPASVRQVYVLSAGGLVPANSEYLRAFVGIPAEIVRIVDAGWECGEKEGAIAFGHESVGGIVTLTARLPDCARFFFAFSAIDARALVDGRIVRNDSIEYEFPEARVIAAGGTRAPALDLGRSMVAHIRPRGPARFIIEQRGSGTGIAWFDIR